MRLTYGRMETIARSAWRAAHAAWDGGGSLERTSRPESERYRPTAEDEAAVDLRTDRERDEFRAEFEDAARQIVAEGA